MNDKCLKPCPFRVHGERIASLTIAGEFYYKESFMPCMGEDCMCYRDDGDAIRCYRDNLSFILDDKKRGSEQMDGKKRK